MSTAEVVAKAIGIVTAIDRCGCEHCLQILKSGLSNPTVPNHADANDDPTTITGTNQNGRQDREYSS